MIEDKREDEEEALVIFSLPHLPIGDDSELDFSDQQIIGLETDNPILRLGNFILEGHWDETVGSNLLFGRESAQHNESSREFDELVEVLDSSQTNNENRDNVDDSQPGNSGPLKMIGKTCKILRFNLVKCEAKEIPGN